MLMKSDFNPDIIIGSIVAAKLDKPKEDDLMNQIENMVMQKSDYNSRSRRWDFDAFQFE